MPSVVISSAQVTAGCAVSTHGMELAGEGNGKDLGGVGEGKIVIRIYEEKKKGKK